MSDPLFSDWFLCLLSLCFNSTPQNKDHFSFVSDCEQLAENTVIITSYNFNSLLLSNYDTSPGTQVNVSCLSKKTHDLVGPNALTCLPSGQWNDTIPTCVAIKPTPDPVGTVAPG